MVHAICSLSEIDPFQQNADEMREQGYSVNRSLADTARARDAWIARRFPVSQARTLRAA